MWKLLEHIATYTVYVITDVTAVPGIQDHVVGLVTQLHAA
jgi:hypothetical protein